MNYQPEMPKCSFFLLKKLVQVRYKAKLKLRHETLDIFLTAVIRERAVMIKIILVD